MRVRTFDGDKVLGADGRGHGGGAVGHAAVGERERVRLRRTRSVDNATEA